MPLFSSTGHILQELFGKTDKWIYKQTNATLYALGDVFLHNKAFRRKNISCVMPEKFTNVSL